MKLLDKSKRRADARTLGSLSEKLSRLSNGIYPDLSAAMSGGLSDRERRNVRLRAALAASDTEEVMRELKVLRAAVASELRTMASHIAATKAYTASMTPKPRRKFRGERK